MKIYLISFIKNRIKLSNFSNVFLIFIRLLYKYKQTLVILLSMVNTFANENEKIIFLHIPKSGGVSVSSMLMDEYDYSQIYNHNPQNILLYSYGLHNSLFYIEKKINTLGFKIITFLRNPIDRILSEHRYCMLKHNADPAILNMHNLPGCGDPIYTASNNMCKQLSGLDDQDSSIPIIEHLKNAKENLKNRFYFIGITENMQESIHLLYKKLGWEIPKEVSHFNKTEKIQFSSEVLQGIRERNREDIELYEFALDLYNYQKNQINHLPQFKHRKNEDFVTSRVYTFDQKLKYGYGWALREEFNGSIIYRWVTEKNEAGIDFNLYFGNDYTVQFTALIQPILCKQLHLFVNGIDIPLEVNDISPEDDEYKFLNYHGRIPKELVQKEEKTSFIFKMIAPKDMSLYKIFIAENIYQTILMNYLIGKFGISKIEVSKVDFQ